jgi:hypothetical protein
MLFNTMTETTTKVKPPPLKGREASVCDLDHSTEIVGELPEPHSAKHGSYVMANVPKRRVVVVHPSVSETLIDGPAASGTVHSDGAKNGGETTQSRKPWPAEFGWDFPFDFPKPGR